MLILPSACAAWGQQPRQMPVLPLLLKHRPNLANPQDVRESLTLLAKLCRIAQPCALTHKLTAQLTHKLAANPLRCLNSSAASAA